MLGMICLCSEDSTCNIQEMDTFKDGKKRVLTSLTVKACGVSVLSTFSLLNGRRALCKICDSQESFKSI